MNKRRRAAALRPLAEAPVSDETPLQAAARRWAQGPDGDQDKEEKAKKWVQDVVAVSICRWETSTTLTGG